MADRWWIDVCPECNGRVEATVQTHNETCPNRGRVFAVKSVRVLPVEEHERAMAALRANALIAYGGGKLAELEALRTERDEAVKGRQAMQANWSGMVEQSKQRVERARLARQAAWDELAALRAEHERLREAAQAVLKFDWQVYGASELADALDALRAALDATTTREEK